MNSQPQAPSNAVLYICGECGLDTAVRPKEPIKCKECGYRILYKKRTRNIVQYEAR